MKKQWIELGEKMRKPHIILIAVFIIGLVLNAGLYVKQIIPQFLFSHNLSSQFKQLDKQRIALERIVMPPRISSEDIAGIVNQVPLSKDAAKFIVNLNQIEQQTKAKLIFITNENVTTDNLADELISADGKANINATYNTNANKAKPSPDPANAQTTVTNGGFVEEKISITLLGSYPQLLEFVSKLQQLTRFVKIREWSFEPVATLPAANSDNPLDDLQTIVPKNDLNVQGQQQMIISLSYYSAKQYAAKFKDVLPLHVSGQPEDRLDPTITDEDYLDIVKSHPENRK